MDVFLVSAFRTIAQILTAGIAITATSLLLYALTFNLRDRVARSFATILFCVVIVFSGKAVSSAASTEEEIVFWLHLQWVGLGFLPAAYLHFSDALLATTGRPSRGRRRALVYMSYALGLGFFVTLASGWLVGSLITGGPAPYLERTALTIIFTLFYMGSMVLAWINLWRAFQRTRTPTSRRRMVYLMIGALAPALGSFPYLLYGSTIAEYHPLFFWVSVTLNTLLTTVLLVVMAYAVAFFGVSWPDRVIRSRLLRWILRGPVTASTTLAVVTLVRRAGEARGISYTSAVPLVMVGTVIIFEHVITIFAPIWERFLFHGSDGGDVHRLQLLEEKLLTRRDLHQFLEAILAAVCDNFQVNEGFIASLGADGPELMVTMGKPEQLQSDQISQQLLEVVQSGSIEGLFSWGDFWVIPLYHPQTERGDRRTLGLLGVTRGTGDALDEDQYQALLKLADRASLALEDRRMQQEVFTAVEVLTPQVDLIHRLRAAARYNGRGLLTSPEEVPSSTDLTQWVKDALNHFWGGPKLAKSPLMRLRIVAQAMEEHDDNPVNALRAILRQAVERVRPEGERRFTAEWILYNILEMKFMEGRKVREVALRLAMSEADLYRKQRVAVEAVAQAIEEMEHQARSEKVAEDEIIVSV
ncbi:MAG: histidine kinase N-terminal 7TM domain-containing protein [Chloroflexota bacterium]